MNQNNTLYKAYLEKKKENKIRNKMLKKYNISDDENTIIINKKSNKPILFIWDILSKIFKVVFYLAIAILVTIGATVLLNTELRDYIINLVNIGKGI